MMEPLFGEHPLDQDKCPLNRGAPGGVPSMEVVGAKIIMDILPSLVSPGLNRGHVLKERFGCIYLGNVPVEGLYMSA